MSTAERFWWMAIMLSQALDTAPCAMVGNVLDRPLDAGKLPWADSWPAQC